MLRGALLCSPSRPLQKALQGAYQRNGGEPRVARLWAETRKYAIVPFDMGMVEHFARLRAARRRGGREIETADAWIAATALWAQCPVVTHNVGDFAGIDGLEVITESD